MKFLGNKPLSQHFSLDKQDAYRELSVSCSLSVVKREACIIEALQFRSIDDTNFFVPRPHNSHVNINTL